ncbi:EAL domain-containing protein [Allonocardiopsis opalescens]|uniref:EAL domain-containing protein (Putative c-di-GMP-specific phosphodiesterase class I) n=1 Tax=Allonocardiopsis opalescens TaxID=1144618 RepID=A0A2T0PUM7_9ACTN|nr:EAL domain-containing protein [Allonocardiopsis opalescens]PRX92508.1 EAL domain-containing protein (putative c-di-GMP-specific phosphodiesterase class I) [Allonocardiopsis opalescens]
MPVEQLRRHDALDVGFAPVIDLESGAVVAVEARIAPGGRTDENAPPGLEDAERVSRAARGAAAHENLLPLLLPVRVSTVAYGQERLALLHRTLRELGRRPREVILMLTGNVGGVEEGRLLSGAAALREHGYLVSLGTSHVPPDLLLTIQPYLLRLDPELIAGVPGDDRRTTLVTALAELGRRLGTYMVAAGVHRTEQLAALRSHGVRLAQGPLIADEDWMPADRVQVPVAAPVEPPAPGRAEVGPRVSEFVTPARTMANDTTAELALDAFSHDPKLTSLVLLDEFERPVALLDRTRFLLAVAGPYGHALHAHRPARRLAGPPRIVPRTMPAMAALRAAGRGEEDVYDDLVVTDELGRCAGIVRVSDLIQGMDRF